jgi:AcrR family transcriptional regulator
MSNPMKNGASAAPKPGRIRQKARTRRLLIDAAVALIAAGRQPTVSEVADSADVSRRTAYRYFPTQEKLHAEAALDGLRPIMESAIASAPVGANATDIESRVDKLVESMQRLAIDNESLLRTMIHQTVLERPVSGQPRRGTRRVDWIESTLKPLRARLGGAAYARLVSALALCTGIEALLVLRDICGLSPSEAVQTSQWLARAALRQSLNEREAARRRLRHR